MPPTLLTPNVVLNQTTAFTAVMELRVQWETAHSHWLTISATCVMMETYGAMAKCDGLGDLNYQRAGESRSP